MAPMILIVDDDETQRKMLQKILIREGYNVEIAASGHEALEKFGDLKANIVITDIKMPDMDGLQLFYKLKDFNRDVSVILMTAYGTIDSAVQAMADGASYYLTKPLDINRLKVLIKKALGNKTLLIDDKNPQKEIGNKYDFSSLVGQSQKMQDVYNSLRKVADSDVTVLLLGETGTGKELAAHAIHQNSSRRDYPFIKVSCASFPEALLESALFGHERGSYTGADSRRIGVFESADKGTIFLDEIGEINHTVQVKLLRFLQEKQFERVGGNQVIKVDSRVIAATNLEIEKAVREGRFRKDLYYRLNVVSISMPPLRERKDDISLLVEHFLEKYKDKSYGKKKKISSEVLSILMLHDWPGNVRELENCIERAIVMGEEDIIQVSDLPHAIYNESIESLDNEIMDEIPANGVSLDQIERNLMIKALEQSNWNQTEAAKMLGITRRKLQYRMDKYGISTKDRIKG